MVVNSKNIINHILEEVTITDFLANMGIYPDRISGDKLMYKCPVHQGDNDPSFIVYPVGTDGRKYQTYHCFGCHSGINLINLKADIDKVSKREAIKFFLKDVHIDHISIQDDVIRESKELLSYAPEDSRVGSHDVEKLMLVIIKLCKTYLDNCDNDEEEFLFFENNFYKKIEEMGRANNYDTLMEYYERLLNDNILANRMKRIKKKKEEEEASSSRWII